MVSIERQDLRDQVYQVLRNELIRGRLLPGERLHVGKLADRLNVSPTPVKEALSRLLPEGLIEVGPRGGAFVSRLTAADVRETFELRELLEQFAAARALEAVTDADCDRLAALCEALRQHVGDGDASDYDRFAAEDINFHRALMDLSGNQQIARIYEAMHVYTVVARSYYLLQPDRNGAGHAEPRRHVYLEHLAIVNALRARDPVALRAAVHDHLHAVEFFALRAVAAAEVAAAAPDRGDGEEE